MDKFARFLTFTLDSGCKFDYISVNRFRMDRFEDEATARMDYNDTQHGEYLDMTARVGGHWLTVFEDDTEFYSAAYWDLFTRLWQHRDDIRKTDALKFMTAVKSAHTAGKYLDTAIGKGMVVERENPADARSKLVALSPSLRQRLDEFFDSAVGELRRSAGRVDAAVSGP